MTKKSLCRKFVLFILTAALSVPSFAQSTIELRDQTLSHPSTGTIQIKVPDGYELEIVNSELDRPRMIEFAPNGDMFIGSTSRVYLLKPPYDQAIDYLFLNGYPHSVAIRGQEIFIATTAALFKSAYDPSARRITSGDLTLVARLPAGFGHSSRTVKVGPNNDVFVSIGISGNCSDQMISLDYPFKDRRGGILRLDESSDRAKFVPFASGLRNPVGFDWHPTSNVMYASNNGPDHLGFEQPPEYFSKLTPGSFHGMPWYQFDGEKVFRDPCAESEPPFPMSEVKIPVALFHSRSAPLGIGFVPTGAMDSRFEHSAIIAIHGSWGTQPDGLFTGPAASRRHPAVLMVQFEDEEAKQVVPVITGFQNEDGRRWARPAGVGVGPDGALYITTDGGDLRGLLRLKRTDN